MSEAMLEQKGHVFGSKVIRYLMSQAAKMENMVKVL
jgi:hypothetical protein